MKSPFTTRWDVFTNTKSHSVLALQIHQRDEEYQRELRQLKKKVRDLRETIKELEKKTKHNHRTRRVSYPSLSFVSMLTMVDLAGTVGDVQATNERQYGWPHESGRGR